jgi:hypothetical protein
MTANIDTNTIDRFYEAYNRHFLVSLSFYGKKSFNICHLS